MRQDIRDVTCMFEQYSRALLEEDSIWRWGGEGGGGINFERQWEM